MINSKEIDNKFLKAQELYKKGNEQESINLLKEIAKESSSYLPAFNILGLIYLKHEKFDDAKIYFKKFYEIKKDNPVLNLNYSKVLYKLNELELAKNILLGLLVKNDNFEVIHLLGIINFKLRLFNESYPFIEKAIKLKPEDGLLNYIFGKLLMERDRHTEGLKYLQKGAGFIEFFENKTNIVN